MKKKKSHIVEAGKQTRFTSDNQPEIRGRKGKSTTEYLREIGNSKNAYYHITLIDKDGKETTRSGNIESENCINELLAVLLVVDAINGSHKAMKEYLDRTEGKPKQSVDLKVKTPEMTPEERQARIAELKLKLNSSDDGKRK